MSKHHVTTVINGEPMEFLCHCDVISDHTYIAFSPNLA